MRKILYFLSLVILILFINFVIFSLANKNQNSNQNVISPVPNFLSLINNKQVSTLTLFLPSLENIITAKFTKPQITAKSVLVFDTTTKQVLYSKNPKSKLPMASLTKIMTAIVSLENPKKDDKYFVYAEDLVGEDSVGLEAGEVLSLKELLYGLILHSGNDAAQTLASNFPKGPEAFTKAMNNKAKSLGLTDTNFTNPSGLEGDGNQYTTAYDLVVITQYALFNFPLFADVSKTFDVDIAKNVTHKEYILENETNLISSYEGVKGVKTGFTPEAGYCLVTYLDYGGHKIIAVILGSGDRRQEMKDLLDYSLKSIGITPPNHS